MVGGKRAVMRGLALPRTLDGGVWTVVGLGGWSISRGGVLGREFLVTGAVVCVGVSVRDAGCVEEPGIHYSGRRGESGDKSTPVVVVVVVVG